MSHIYPSFPSLSNSDKVQSGVSSWHSFLNNNSTCKSYWRSLTTEKNSIFLLHTEFHTLPYLGWKEHSSVRFLMLYFLFIATSCNYWSFSWSFSTNPTIHSALAYLLLSPYPKRIILSFSLEFDPRAHQAVFQLSCSLLLVNFLAPQPPGLVSTSSITIKAHIELPL